MEFLMNFHFLKDTKQGHRKRHGFKGKTYKGLEKWNSATSFVLPESLLSFNLLKHLQ